MFSWLYITFTYAIWNRARSGRIWWNTPHFSSPNEAPIWVCRYTACRFLQSRIYGATPCLLSRDKPILQYESLRLPHSFHATYNLHQINRGLLMNLVYQHIQTRQGKQHKVGVGFLNNHQTPHNDLQISKSQSLDTYYFWKIFYSDTFPLRLSAHWFWNSDLFPYCHVERERAP